MPDTGAPWNIPYVASTDLVSDWPADSLALANAIDAGLDAANVGIGSNVVQTVKTDTFTTTSTSFTDVTGLTVTITPSSATSKILLIADVKFSHTAVANTMARLRLFGGNADTYIADAASNRSTTAAGNETGVVNWDSAAGARHATLVYLDSPATTSPVTYSVQVAEAGSGSGTVVVNRTGVDTDSANYPRFASSITAIEVAA